MDGFKVTEDFAFDELFKIFNVSGDKKANASSSAADVDADVFRRVLLNLNVYFVPVIICIGILGNVLSCLVFCLTHLKQLSSSFYLASLAVADIGFLVSLFFIWVEQLDIHIFTKEGWCPAVVYLTKVCGFLAIWNVVSFTSERYVIVYQPLKKDRFCTRRNAKIVLLVLVLVSSLTYLYIFWTYDVIRFAGKAACSPIPEHHNIITVMDTIDTLCACVIPSLWIIVLNIRMISKIHKYQKIRFEMTDAFLASSEQKQQQQQQQHKGRVVAHASISTDGSVHIKFIPGKVDDATVCGTAAILTIGSCTGNKRAKIAQGQNQLRTARMLLVLSSVFVLIILPNHVFQVLAFFHHLLGQSARQSKLLGKWQELSHIVYFLNFAINFFIYSACGRQFRTGLKRLGSRWKYTLRKYAHIVFHRDQYLI